MLSDMPENLWFFEHGENRREVHLSFFIDFRVIIMIIPQAIGGCFLHRKWGGSRYSYRLYEGNLWLLEKVNLK